MSRIRVKVWVCDLCGHRWWKYRKSAPRCCANCKNPNWDKFERPVIEPIPEPEPVQKVDVMSLPVAPARALPKRSVIVIK